MTDAEYPYPQLVMGNIDEPHPYTYGGHEFSGFPNPGTVSTTFLAPGWIRLPGGTPKPVINWNSSSGNEGYTLTGVGIQPAGHQYNSNAGGADSWYTASSTFSWKNIVDVDDSDSTSKEKLQRIDSKYIPVPLSLSWQVDRLLLGTIPGMYWFDNTTSTLQSEDRLIIDGIPHRVFQNCKKTNRNNMFCVIEA